MKRPINFPESRASGGNNSLLKVLRRGGITILETLFSRMAFLSASNENFSPPEPEPPQSALAVAVNDNGPETDDYREAGIAGLVGRRTMVIASGVIIVAASAKYFLTPLDQVSGCNVKKITPDTSLSDLNEIQRDDLIAAMTRQEGAGPNTTSTRGRNPGNLNDGPFARAHGAVGSIHGIAVFPSEEVGRRAMKALIFGVYGARSIYLMLAGDPARGLLGYAPSVKDQFGNVGKPRLYAEHVAAWMNEMAAKRAGTHGCSLDESPRLPQHRLTHETTKSKVQRKFRMRRRTQTRGSSQPVQAVASK